MRKLLAVLLSACIAAVSWPANGSLTPLIFVAFIPLLWLEREIRTDEKGHKGRRVFLYSWLSFGLFVLFTSWWVSFAHWSGTAGATVVNGLIMAFCFWLYFKVNQQIGEGRGMFMLPFLWMCGEYLQIEWDFSYPWLNLGYVFANRPTWIQWYSITGMWGGTIWVLWTNAILFKAWKGDGFNARLWKSAGFRILFMILIPIGVSLVMYSTYEEVGEEIEVVVVQPNFDPYVSKFKTTDEDAISTFLNYANEHVSPNTRYVIGPETMIRRGLDEDVLSYQRTIRVMNGWIDQHPGVSILLGATTTRRYETAETFTARELGSGRGFYDVYNTALQLNGEGKSIDIYHKSKLVVGVEMVPLASILQPLLKNGIDLGGATGSLGTQETRDVFSSEHSPAMVGSVICWEAEFPGYTAEYVKNGANVLFAITNDGWWGDTPGKTQHMYYASLRAIENRRSIARSANTGISCVINQRGDISHEIPYGEGGAFAATIRLNDEITTFSNMGDLLGRVAVFMSIAVVLSVFVRRKTMR